MKRVLFVILSVVSLCNVLRADDSFYIKWIGELSNKTVTSADASFGEKIMGFIFGSENVRLKRPNGLFIKSDRECFFIDQGTGSLGRIDLETKRLRLVNKTKDLKLYSAVGICKFGEDSVLITDSGLNKVFLFDIAKNRFSVWNDTLKLNRPTGIAYYPPQKAVLIVETGRHRLIILDKNGRIIRIIGKRGKNPGEFNFPTFVWVDKFGTIYVNDSMNFRVQILNFDGRVKQVFGKAGDASGYFARPKGIATDSMGHIFVVDALFHVVQVFDQEGNLLTYFGKQGRGNGEFWMPTDIFIDNNDRIYIADSYNSRIQIFELKSRDGHE
ncbi:MAG: 6-bladed beta-propeller [Calditrichaeota bacterium]|nr:6-bladed beta-propeller [Calditrichota bacterium]